MSARQASSQESMLQACAAAAFAANPNSDRLAGYARLIHRTCSQLQLSDSNSVARYAHIMLNIACCDGWIMCSPSMRQICCLQPAHHLTLFPATLRCHTHWHLSQSVPFCHTIALHATMTDCTHQDVSRLGSLWARQLHFSTSRTHDSRILFPMLP